MDKQTYIIARNFFRGEIKTLAERIKHNKYAYRENQRIASKGLEKPDIAYIGAKHNWEIHWVIASDKANITALHILYAKLRGKQHVKERENAYSKNFEAINKRMEEYIAKEQVAHPETAEVAVGG